MKGFNIAPPPGSSSTTSLPPVAELIASLQLGEHPNLPSSELFGSTLSGLLGSTPGLTMRRTYTGPKEIQPNHTAHALNKLATKRSSSRKRKWDSLIEATRLGRVGRLINRSRSEDSVCNGKNGENRNSQSPLSDENNITDSDSNPSLIDKPESNVSLLLKHKRRIFSASRNPPGEAGSSLDSKEKKTFKKHLKRASSVPTRAAELPVPPAKHEQTQSQQQSVDIQQQGMLTPSTTEESVTPGAAGNDTNGNGSSAESKNRNGLVTVLPNLGIQPLSGHNVSAGWL